MALPETDFDARARALAERALAPPVPFPTSWLPLDREAGHANPLIGLMQRADPAQTVNGPATVLVLRDGAGEEWGVWVFHETAFEKEYRRKLPQPGELVCVTYEGLKPVKNPQAGRNKEFHSYVLTVERDDGPASTAPAVQSHRLAEASREHEVATAVVEEPTPVASAPRPKFCRDCGTREPEHADGCPSDIPF